MSKFKTTLNFMRYWVGMRDTGFLSNEVMGLHSPAEHKDLLAEAVASMEFDPAKVDEYFPPDVHTNFEASRITGIEGFDAFKDAATKLPDTDQGSKAVKAAIVKALELTPEYLSASQQYVDGMKQVKAAIADTESKYDPETMLTRMHILRSNYLAAIRTQQTAESKALAAVFSDPTHQQTLRQQFGIANEAAYKKITEEDAPATLKKSQQDGLTTCDKAIKEPLIKMHDMAQLEVDRVFYLATLYQHNKDMQREMEALYDRNHQPGTASISISQGPNPFSTTARFKGMKVTDLNNLQTMLGRKIHKSKDEKGDPVFTMEFGNNLWYANEHIGSKQQARSHLQSLAAAVRASGYDSITMNLDGHKNTEHGRELARKAYEECLRTGFAPEKITIKINGEVKDLKALYEGQPSSRLAGFQQEARDAAAARRTAVAAMSTVTKPDAAVPDLTQSNRAAHDLLKERLTKGRMQEELPNPLKVDQAGNTTSPQNP